MEVFERSGRARPECLSFVPEEDAEYQTMIIPKFWFQFAQYLINTNRLFRVPFEYDSM